MKAARPDRRTASLAVLLGWFVSVSKGYASWSLFPGSAQKAALGLKRAPTLAEKPKSPKSVVLSQGTDVVGVPPAPRKGWLAGRCGYTSFSATASIAGAKCDHGNSVGATPDPRYGCSVNTAEQASRLIRLHCRVGSGLNGWRYCVQGEQQ